MRRRLADISSSQTGPSTYTAQLLGPLMAFGAALAIAYATMVRPWMLTWGSTEEERTRPLPGDDLVPAPTHSTTHAITIHAPPYTIWPWLVQMGQDRAGFYTHNWVEKLLFSGIPDVHALMRSGRIYRLATSCGPCGRSGGGALSAGRWR